MLFIDDSIAFNTILPTKLITKLRTLGLNTYLCNWIGNNTSATLILKTGAPQGCAFRSLLFSLFTHD